MAENHELEELERRATVLSAHPIDREFGELSADAGEYIRQDLVERMVPYLRRLRQDHPDLHTAASSSSSRPTAGWSRRAA